MSIRGDGVLAIWSDVAAEVETDYRHWFSREHVLERVGCDGFLAGRVFRTLAPGLRRYFFSYELADAGALAGPSYLARLNAPTPWSQRIMPILQNFARGGGRVVARAGSGLGGVVSPIRLSLADSSLGAAGAGAALVQRLVAFDGVASAWLMQVDQQATGVQTREKSLRRSVESGFDAVLCVEGLTPAEVAAAAASAMAGELAGAVADTEPPLFGLCFALDRRIGGLPAADVVP